jgi:excisionase family DNA binding protein
MAQQGIQANVTDAALERLLTIAECCELLQISRQTLYRLINGGELVPTRVSERVRFEPADIRAYLERNRELTPEMREPDLCRAQDSRDENVNEDAT